MDNAHFSTHKGLTAAQVEESRRLHGRNLLTPQQKMPLWRMFMAKFADPLIVILLIIGVFAVGVSCYEYLVLHESATVFFEPAGIFVAIMLATGLAFYFELKAQKEFTLLNQENDHEPVAVVRDGNVTEIPKCDVVVGDVLVLSAGQEIPADARLLEAVSLIVDESSLTGEPAHEKEAIADRPSPTLSVRAGENPEAEDSDATYPRNCVYRGTQVMEGHAVAVVTAVGDHTENGRIMQSLTGVEYSENHMEALNDTQQRAARLQQKNTVTQRVNTPLNEQLDRLSLWITRISYAIAIAVIIGRMLTYNAEGLLDGDISHGDISHTIAYTLQTIMIAVTLVVVAVPEGLPMAVSLALAGSMRRMLKTNNLVRRMHACETMGAATVICTDKTGTLTENRMQVREILADASLAERLHECMAVNSTAALDFSADAPHVVGNPTEGALLLYLNGHGIDYRSLRDSAVITEQTPFSTERKYMSTLADGRLYIKGAPEIVMQMADDFGCEYSREDYRQALSAYQQRALRTLAFACKEGQTVRFLGIVGIADPVRSDVKQAVAQCMQAGIKIKIVTGDTIDTAREIGRQIGIIEKEDKQDAVIDGREFGALNTEALLQRVDRLKIIARARPMDKKRLVEALQQRGEVVAVTGDGTNDAPALNAAHVGLSMGSGTSVAKEASDITITDDSFSSIVRAVEWGRSLFQNIQRFLLFQLTVNVAACLLVLCGAFMGTQSPLTVTQMLWVNLIMDTFAAFAMSALPPSNRVMNDPPRNRHAFILDRSMLRNIMGVGVFFFLLLVGMLYVFKHNDVHSLSQFYDAAASWLSGCNSSTALSHDKAQRITPYELTLLFTTFVMTHFWYMFCARAYNSGSSAFNMRHCRSFVTIAVVIFLGQIAMVQLPVLNTFFNVVPLTLSDWLIIILLSSLVVWVREAKRLIFRGTT